MQTNSFNNDEAVCAWEQIGMMPETPVTACYETVSFNDVTCVWDVSGTQPAAPTGLECYEIPSFDDATCAWVVENTQESEPATECYETATFDDVACEWVVEGDAPAEPTDLECRESTELDNLDPTSATYCTRVVDGQQPEQPTDLACYESVSFDEDENSADYCTWVVEGDQPSCLEVTCNADGTFTQQVYSETICGCEEIIVDGPQEPTTECYETVSFNTNSCAWDVTGEMPTAPGDLECRQTAVFLDDDSASADYCTWIVEWEQPEEPTQSACYESAEFNAASCEWEIMWAQEVCGQTVCSAEGTKTEYTYDEDTCGCTEVVTQIDAPSTECYETVSFDSDSCERVIDGEMPGEPTWLACYESAMFDKDACERELVGEQPVCADVVCNANGTFTQESFDGDACECISEVTEWIVQPNIACYETASFDVDACEWNVSWARQSCDDNNPNTINDMQTETCECVGELVWVSHEFQEYVCHEDIVGIVSISDNIDLVEIFVTLVWKGASYEFILLPGNVNPSGRYSIPVENQDENSDDYILPWAYTLSYQVLTEQWFEDVWSMEIEFKEECGYCGDGIIQEELNEVCDDGNDDDSDGCAACRIFVEENRRNTGGRLRCSWITPDTLTSSADVLSQSYSCELGGDISNLSLVQLDCGNGTIIDFPAYDKFRYEWVCEYDRASWGSYEPRCIVVNQDDQFVPGSGACIGSVEFVEPTNICGDGIVTIDIWEECDDGNTENGDGCSSSCVLEMEKEAAPEISTQVCGNGIVEWSEECDGNELCLENCTLIVSHIIEIQNVIIDQEKQSAPESEIELFTSLIVPLILPNTWVDRALVE